MSRAARLVERLRGKEALLFLERLSARGWPRDLRMDWWDLKGQAYQQIGEFRAAHRSYRAAYRLAGSGPDRWRSTEISLRLGDMLRQLERFEDALDWYELARRSARATRRREGELDALCGRAMSLRGLGRYDAALQLFSRLRSAYRRRGDKEGEAYVLWAMGTTERFAGNLASANEHLANAVALYKRLQDRSGLAYAQCGWGGTLRMMGEARRSGQLYAQANKVFVRVGDQFGIAYSSCGQANALRMRGKLRAALPFMARAEKGYRVLRLAGPLGFVLWSRAQLRVEQRFFSHAARDLRQSEKAFRKARDPRGLVYVALGRAELALAQGRPFKNLYRVAANRARKHHLPFEEAHARVRAGLAEASIYRRFGVSFRKFLTYRSLP